MQVTLDTNLISVLQKQKDSHMRLVSSLTIRWKMWLVILKTQGRITNAPAAGKYTAMNVKQENFLQNTKNAEKSIEDCGSRDGTSVHLLSRHKTANLILQQMLRRFCKKMSEGKSPTA